MRLIACSGSVPELESMKRCGRLKMSS
uniref:Uncharacterized protein n=1 Tax=Rhizophora mucronata TaxID=61149 RepID=A0A2P2JKF3_RHIMU